MKKIPRTQPVKKIIQPKLKKNTGFQYALVPLILAILLFANTLPNQYCLDDYAVIVNNDWVHQGISAIPKLLTTNYFNGLNNFNDGLYRPVPMITYAVEYSLVGLDPALRHFMNMLIYGLTGMLIFIFLKSLFKGTSIILPLSIALLYIAHPVHTESVANVKGRDELLAFLFGLLAMYYFLVYADRNKMIYIGLGLLFYALSVLSKENAIAFLIIIPLTLLFFRRLKKNGIILVLSSLVLVTAIWLLWRYHVIHSMTMPVNVEIFSGFNNSVLSTSDFFSRIATGLKIQTLYFFKLLLPVSLTDDYSFNQIPVISLFSFMAVISFLWIAGLMAAGIVTFKKERIILYAVLFYFITLFPVSNILIYIGATFAERFLCTPSFGFSILTGFLLYKIIRKNNAPQSLKVVLLKNLPYTLIMAILLLFYSTLTVIRNFEWKNNYSLYSADISRSANSARAHYNLGTELYSLAASEKEEILKSQYIQKACREFQIALSIFPTYEDAMCNMGNALGLAGKRDSAIILYKRILAIDSNYQKSFYNIGINYYALKNYEEAIIYLKRYLYYHPDNKDLYYYLADACGNTGKMDDAVLYLEQYMKFDSRNINVLGMLGKAYGIKGQLDKAITCFKEALKIEPDNQDINFNMGMTCLFLNQPGNSIPFFEKCIRLNPKNKGAYEQIIQAYKRLGDKVNADLYSTRLAGF